MPPLYTAYTFVLFQSTHPVWDATVIDRFMINGPYFNPRIPYGMRRAAQIVVFLRNRRISIHASRMGCDLQANHYMAILGAISIHASRMGCDSNSQVSESIFRVHFNPRIPYGMRRFSNVNISVIFVFQSTHPVWDATLSLPRSCKRRLTFQSTHPVWDATDCLIRDNHRANFNPRIPYGMRRLTAASTAAAADFNPRIPYGMRLNLFHGFLPTG